MLEKFKGLLVEEEGQGMVEYGLIVGLISVVVVALLVTVGDNLKEVFTDIGNALDIES
ncbi:pilus assembly protein Flp/PilA [Alkalibacillus filiformis]|uniref:Pilus assembly protein Flp/PilA n=1 Tax=Alkalibacillus filiformis TaxID=200990 RepID=A0ABU0DR23_9BACI|nr:Flp family type IVb pilin [Alkalibacillus filiformis]MDQ0350784.1 pilus assembly protein Flp/PilA [Alkalibacillus filiformis]